MTVHNNMAWTEDRLAKEGWIFEEVRTCFQCSESLAIYYKGSKKLRLEEGTLETHVC